MKPHTHNIAVALRALMTRLNLNANQLSIMTGISRSQFGFWLSGKRASNRSIKVIAHALRIKPTSLAPHYQDPDRIDYTGGEPCGLTRVLEILNEDFVIRDKKYPASGDYPCTNSLACHTCAAPLLSVSHGRYVQR
jgi:transcriptional regulator with XRE-family HTH domain